jgi:hypothetical protein
VEVCQRVERERLRRFRVMYNNYTPLEVIPVCLNKRTMASSIITKLQPRSCAKELSLRLKVSAKSPKMSLAVFNLQHRVLGGRLDPSDN